MRLVFTTALAIALLSGFNAAHAAPPASPAPPSAPDILLIADGCGVGFHRTPTGVCRPQAKGPALMRAFARKCPVGYRRNLLGKCRRE
jgi:hypothetical protein